MANVEGNEIALRQVASELFPPVRSGQNALIDQDTFGPPFVTTTETNVSTTYSTTSIAPGWVYGLILEKSEYAGDYVSDNPVPPEFFVSFGTASTANETLIQYGQELLFPRGARRIFLRCSQPNHGVKITWVTDRFARKALSGTSLPTITRTWRGDRNFESLDMAAGVTTVIAFDSYTWFSAVIRNTSAATAATYTLQWYGITLDTGAIPPSSVRVVSYGPGVGALAAPFVGHGIVLPAGAVEFYVTSPPGVGIIEWEWRGV